MKKYFFAHLTLLVCMLPWPCRNLFAQLPQVYFTSGTNVCDDSPWKLVFYDGFSGTELDRTKWYSFNTNGGYTNDDWCQGRIPYPGNESVISDANCIVSDGTLKLQVKQNTQTWTCATCPTSTCTDVPLPYTKNYTSGYIGSKALYNSGKIEARLRMPLFPFSWGTCWTWYQTRVNEIDFAEATGGSRGSRWPYIVDRPNNTYNLHAWAPKPNIYSLPENAVISNDFPNQSWWNWIRGTNHRQEAWHTYVCEWDTAVIRTYLDGVLVNSIWKYYQIRAVRIPSFFGYRTFYMRATSGCLVPGTGYWNVTEGFPYNNESSSKLIFSVGIKKEDKLLSADGWLGAMEIDYVKVFQRHPEDDGHTEICTTPPPSVTGPETICGLTTYTTSPPTTGGMWYAANDAINFVGGTGGSSVNVQPNPASSNSVTALHYAYTPPGCPPVIGTKVANTGSIAADVTVLRNWHATTESFSFIASPIPLATYNWKIWYGFTSSSTSYYTSSAGFIAITPSMVHWGILPYYVRWELTITTPCGSRTLNGTKSFGSFAAYRPPNLDEPSTFMTQDSSTFYLETRFTEADSFDYEQTVQELVGASYVENIDDTLSIAQMIYKIQMEALSPYIYFEKDSSSQTIQSFVQLPASNVIAEEDKSSVYPNPALGLVLVQLNSSFEKGKETNYKIYDMLGRMVLQGRLLYDGIDLSGLSAGSYILTLIQEKNVEQIKLSKQ